jgi:hypothetical protein
MEISEAREFVEMLRQIDGRNAQALFRTVRMLVACCQNDSELSAVLLVRTPADEDDAHWMLHIHALNADLDDSYIMLAKATHQVGEHLQAEAPPSEYLN